MTLTFNLEELDTMSRFTDAVSDAKSASAFSLAGMADCMSPDSHESDGALFLMRVRDDVLESVEDIDFDDASDFERETEDKVWEIADSAVPIYTAHKWSTFTDLGAWQTDVSDLAGDESDLDKLGSVALFEIARTLGDAILADLANAIREDDADDEDDETDALIP